MADARAATRAGLALVVDPETKRTLWTFAPLQARIRVGSSARHGGLGLFATHAIVEGEELLRERWLIGAPLAISESRGCAHCLRVCAFNPADGKAGVGCNAGCGARYCSPACRDAAWRQYHRLLCVEAQNDDSSKPPAVSPLAVFCKHARLAPSTIGQKPEDVLLAAEILASCVTWDAGASARRGDDATDEATAQLRTTLKHAAAKADRSRGVLPAPFDTLSSYCVVSAAIRQHGGAAAEPAAACARWVNESYKLLSATKLGRRPEFRERCPPQVYSHALGVLDRNAACAAALPASRLIAPLAGGVGDGAVASQLVEGFGVYPIFSCTNHSCSPNAVNAQGAAADGEAVLDNSLVLRASRPIAAGEEITFDYLDGNVLGLSGRRDGDVHSGATGGRSTRRCHSERRQRLRENFGFDCACARCAP